MIISFQYTDHDFVTYSNSGDEIISDDEVNPDNTFDIDVTSGDALLSVMTSPIGMTSHPVITFI
jgi:hypothetical protein